MCLFRQVKYGKTWEDCLNCEQNLLLKGGSKHYLLKLNLVSKGLFPKELSSFMKLKEKGNKPGACVQMNSVKFIFVAMHVLLLYLFQLNLEVS